MQIQSHVVDLATPTGVMRTYVHRPVGAGPYPALLFYSEIFQQTGPIERSARLFAGHGYVVLVPEVFHELNPIGTVLAYDDAGREKGNADKALKPLEHYDSDNRAMIAYLQEQAFFNGRLGSVGMCLGGHLAYRAALQPEVRAAACFYATDIHSGASRCQPGNDSLSQTANIQAELMLVWGKQDPHIPAAGRARIYQELTERERTFTWHEFNAPHAFIRDEGDRYDPELAMLCYRMALDLFSRKLR